MNAVLQDTERQLEFRHDIEIAGMGTKKDKDSQSATRGKRE